MTTVDSPFVPQRLQFARARCGMSRTKLAIRLDVTTKTLQRWESGDVLPSDLQQRRLAEALRVLPSFFGRDELEHLPEGSVSFRALSKMTAGERDSATANGRLGVEVIEWIEDKFQLPDTDIEALPGHTPELAAAATRASWELGTGPIPHLLAVLELHGARILSLPPGSRSVDAFSFYRSGKPYIFLDTSRTAERQRFDAAHELGHLVIHADHSEPHGRAAEADANAFASAFLMPRESILSSGLRNAALSDVLRHKRHWKVSATALAYRLNELNLMTEWGYRSLCIELSRRGYRSSEPNSALGHETSQVLPKVLKALRAKGIRQKELAAEFGLPVEEFSMFLTGLTISSVPD